MWNSRLGCFGVLPVPKLSKIKDYRRAIYL
jgi:hypothetical protein